MTGLLVLTQPAGDTVARRLPRVSVYVWHGVSVGLGDGVDVHLSGVCFRLSDLVRIRKMKSLRLPIFLLHQCVCVCHLPHCPAGVESSLPACD